LITHLIKVHGYIEQSAIELLKTKYQEQIFEDIQSDDIREDETVEQDQLFIDDYIEEEISSSQPILKSPPETAILLLDCETTGESEPRIVEIFCYDIVSHSIFHYFVNPETSIHPVYGTGVHGYTLEFLKPHGIWKDVGSHWLQWLKSEINKKNTILISHGSYDPTTILKECSRVDLDIPPDYLWLDSGFIVREVLETRKWKLTDIAEQFGINVSQAHSAAGDVFILWAVLQKLYERYIYNEESIYHWLNNYAVENNK
jgi:DNA polymerase III epsilon subunit-like protein